MLKISLERKRKENRIMKKYWFKMTFLIVAVLIFCAIGGLSVAANAGGVETDTIAIHMGEYRTYTFYPDGYKEGYDDVKPFSGTYILTGNPDEDVYFRSYDEPVTYNVIIHELDATASSWYGMLSVDPDVTLNITVYGDCYFLGDNHPGISIATQKEGHAPVVNITMAEGARLSVGNRYHETTICIAPGITVNLKNGESSIDMSVENWQENDTIVFTNGAVKSHEMGYVYVDDNTCGYQCNDCDIVGTINSKHYVYNECYDEAHPDYGSKHIAVCYQCEHEFSSSEHEIQYDVMESAHVAFCWYCPYYGEELGHTLDETGCTVCGATYAALYEVDEESTYIFFVETIKNDLKEKGGKITFLKDVTVNSGLTLNISKDTTIDLAGKTIVGISFQVEADATLNVVDTSKDKSGRWEFTNARASYIDGTLNLDGITVEWACLMVNDGGVLVINNVTGVTKLFVRVSKATAVINGLTTEGFLDLNIDAYWQELDLTVCNVKLGSLVLSTNYGQDININMLLPQGYAFSGEDGLLDGSGVTMEGITAIVEHVVHNNDKLQRNGREHWKTCTCGYGDDPIKIPHSLGTDGCCETCCEKIVASLVHDGATSYYSSLVEALLDSNNYTESTITLLCDVAPNEYKENDVRKNLTFDLNGYKYSVNGRLRVWGCLTIIDSSESKTGKMHESGDISYIIEFHNGSRVILNSGEFFGLIYGAVYNNESATLTINGGRFIGREKFRLGRGTTITVNGGVFENSESVFDYSWSTNVTYVINGGVFINSTVFDTGGFDFFDLEEAMGKDGDCELWFIDSTGHTLTVEELCSYYEGEIFVFHKNANGIATNRIHGLSCTDCGAKSEELEHTIAYAPIDGTASHLVYCVYCEWELATEEHGGGEMTCTSKAVCADCGAEYGEEPQGHKYDNNCDSECNVCFEAREASDHVYENACDKVCDECNYERETTHSYENGVCITCTAADPNWKDETLASSDQNDTENDGIGAVGIILIVVGTVAVLSGGFAAFWFIRKKRSLSNR